ncbi:MAG TPA: hypothetical protein VFL27_11925 [Candidatus Dormibacteraeota bacterium]|nr:hypothetical protein [Candidatus Dormibacteraeota bacterium]
MSPEEAQSNAPRRRGRPPGSKNKTARRRGARSGDLVGQLNSLVAELIKKNRQLQRQVANLTARAEKTRAGRGVERGIKTLQRRVKKALGGTTTKRRRTAASNGRRKRATTTRRRRAT